jgi:hypothetical protein
MSEIEIAEAGLAVKQMEIELLQIKLAMDAKVCQPMFFSMPASRAHRFSAPYCILLFDMPENT